MKLLITGGATREPIDSVRYISNLSTGKTAATIVDAFAQGGHDVHYLSGLQSIQPKLAKFNETYVTFSDLQELLQEKLSRESFDAVIHLAAVSDYSVEKVTSNHREVKTTGKIPTGKSLTVELRPNIKLISEIKNYSINKNVTLVGFKLTHSSEPEPNKAAINKLFSHADFVVHNDLSQIFESGNHHFWLYSPTGLVAHYPNKDALARGLVGVFTRQRNTPTAKGELHDLNS